MAEALKIARISAACSARSGFSCGVQAILLEKRVGIGQRHSAADEWRVHGSIYTATPFSAADKARQCGVDHVRGRAAGLAGSAPGPLAWRGMARRNPRAGGLFLTIGILAGLAWGVARGEPMLGILAGTTLGIAAAVLLWLVDRRR